MSVTVSDSTSALPLAADRDVRFKRMLQRQLGENGVFLLSVYTFLSLLAIVIVSVLSIGYASAASNCTAREIPLTVAQTTPALL